MSDEIPVLPSAAANAEIPQAQILRSWKEVAAYMRRGMRTVQRWEKHLALPVHRVGNRGEVFAFSSEIDAWFQRFSVPSDPADHEIRNWREIAEQASREENPEKLVQLINELTHLLQEDDAKSDKNKLRHPTPGPRNPAA
ncbi:MAG TPA: hypothetical protein VFA89_01680 [Terriglobales bacterium]|nr:hypothetical protein [Terriglobales bacterium]